jgi:SAM-dependent methyltransferase
VSEPRSIRAGGVDWVAVLDEMGRERAAMAVALADEDRWRHRAARFDRWTRAERGADTLPSALAALVRADDESMDIGAGTGRHVVPLARLCRRVIAIEPSEAMRARLEARVREEALTNVEVLADRFPTESAPTADLVFASHVLYGVDDAPAFLCAMDRCARRTAALLLGLSAPPDVLTPLRHALGLSVPRYPAALEALALLHQLGMRASLVMLPGSERAYAVTDEDDDIRHLCHRLSLDPSDDTMARVREALVEVAPRVDGNHVLGTTGPNALLGWSAAGGALR